jgi:hypothetical protein
MGGVQLASPWLARAPPRRSTLDLNRVSLAFVASVLGPHAPALRDEPLPVQQGHSGEVKEEEQDKLAQLSPLPSLASLSSSPSSFFADFSAMASVWSSTGSKEEKAASNMASAASDSTNAVAGESPDVTSDEVEEQQRWLQGDELEATAANKLAALQALQAIEKVRPTDKEKRK